ncbi:MAG: hypothetical protein K9L17_12655 [Clostridiales bacterium]|nr:hypothetical protein [Clostridiales bacterium]MCF8023529.1 hypothetical protein [Clostridiales bacterium]
MDKMSLVSILFYSVPEEFLIFTFGMVILGRKLPWARILTIAFIAAFASYFIRLLKHRIIMGKNFGREISSFKLDINELEFSSDIFGDDYFIRTFEIPKNVSSFDKLTLYDAENNNITEEIRDKYPVIKAGGIKTVMERGLSLGILYVLIIFMAYAIIRFINKESK